MTPSTSRGRTDMTLPSIPRMPEGEQSRQPGATAPWRRSPGRGPSQGPKSDAAAEIGSDRKNEGEPVAAGEVEYPSRCPGPGSGADAAADCDNAEDGAELTTGEEIGGLRCDRRAAGTPGKPEEAGVQPQQPALA